MTVTTQSNEALVDAIKGTRDTLAVGKVFGEAYQLDGVTIIPVARITGGAGGGGGEGTGKGESGSGMGAGFGLAAKPMGIYEVRGGEVTWRPILDIDRVMKAGQGLVGLLAICTTLLLLRRRR